jgi:alkylation response protein AidB-like acyl-CoA dehydrogenase
VPKPFGGTWQSVAQDVRAICESLRLLAQGDSSVALVSAMHPAVLSYWLTSEDVEQHDQGWRNQREQIFAGVMHGDWWGTITSEPGSGGDITRSQTIAEPTAEPLQYRLTGQKHFASGSGVLRYMVTTAVPCGESEADWFYMDLRGVPWDGSTGLKLIAPWDGHGMAATQSHSFALDSFPATRIAWTGHLTDVAMRSSGLIGCLFTSVIVGIVQVALRTARQRLASMPRLGPFQQVEFARAEIEHWLIGQAYEGMIRAVETMGDPRRDVLQGKTAVAELAESVLRRLCQIVGGGSFSRNSPFGFWFEDVRALGFLRPPWSLAFDGLIDWINADRQLVAETEL